MACGDEVVLDGEGGSAASRVGGGGGGGGESSRGETASVAQREESDGRAGTDGEREVLFLDKEHGHGCRRRRGRGWYSGRGNAMAYVGGLVVTAQNAQLF